MNRTGIHGAHRSTACRRSQRSPLDRSGFTSGELLVVIVLVAVLIGLALPAVQKAREAAARTQCANNLKRIGIGMLNYEVGHGVFPSAGTNYGWTDDASPNSPIRNSNGLVLLLPFLDEPALFALYDPTSASGPAKQPANESLPFAGGGVSDANSALAGTQVKLFLCPADMGDPYLPVGTTYGLDSTRAAKTNYDFSTSARLMADYWNTQSETTRRMFGENSNTRLVDIKDGTGNTAMMAETTRTVFNGSAPAWAFRGYTQTGCDLVGAEGLESRLSGINIWTSSSTSFDIPGAAQAGRLGDWGRAGSLHPQGAHVMNADGSVRFWSQSTSTAILERLATIAGDDASEVP